MFSILSSSEVITRKQFCSARDFISQLFCTQFLRVLYGTTYYESTIKYVVYFTVEETLTKVQHSSGPLPDGRFPDHL